MKERVVLYKSPRLVQLTGRSGNCLLNLIKPIFTELIIFAGYMILPGLG